MSATEDGFAAPGVATEWLAEARRTMEVCNACRYCEGFCPVFPAMERRRTFADGDLVHLANLCHDCRGCWHACQYAPPHEFGLNLPRAFAELRAESYAAHVWPGPLARLLERNGLWVALVTVLMLAVALALGAALGGAAAMSTSHLGPGAFYAVIPSGVLIGLGAATFGFAVLALVVASTRYWRASGGGDVRIADVAAALGAAATTRHLAGAGEGCNDVDDRYTMARRRAHLLTMWGLVLCFAATVVAAVMEHLLGIVAPFGWSSAPVVLGAAGGLGLVVGSAWLLRIKLVADPGPRATRRLGMDYALLVLLLAIGATGLALLALRETALMPPLLAVHLGLVLALFVTLPCGKLVHAPFRLLALVREAGERRTENARETGR